MLRWVSMAIVALILTVSVVEYTSGLTPLQQLTSLVGTSDDASAGASGGTVIRVGVASWQMDEFPWDEAIAGYEKAHPDVRVRLSILPEGTMNSMLLAWANQYTNYDVIVAWADEEIHPFIRYNWNSRDRDRRSLIVNVREYLSDEQMSQFMPALFGGSSRKDPDTGEMNLYEVPWMGEVLALNYNKQFFRQRGIAEPPKTWDEVEADCRKLLGLEHDGVKVAPLAMNFSQTGFFGQNSYLPMLAAFKKGRGVADEKGRLDVSSPESVRVFETLKRWYEAGYISPNCMVNEAVEQDLRVLRAAMYPHWQSRGLWAVKDHGRDVIGIAPTPGMSEGGSLVCTYGAIVPRCSPVIRQAVAFAYETFATDAYGFQSAVANGWTDPLTKKVKGGGKMPVLREMYKRTDLLPGIVELAPAMEQGYFYPDPQNWPQVSEILVVEFQKYLSGKTATAEEALANVRRRMGQEVYGE